MTPLFSQGAFAIDPNATPEQIARKRQMIAALMPQFGKARYVGEGLGQLATGVMMGRQNRQLDQRENANTQEGNNLFQRILSGASAQPDAPMTINGARPAMATAPAAPRDPNAPRSIADDTMAALGKQVTPQQMLMQGAKQRGLNPEDVATAISYETGGRLDPLIKGPTTQWGQHRGLIQFGEPQAQKYGVDFSNEESAWRSQLDPNDGAIWKYLEDTGVQSGMGLDQIYSAINAGGINRFNRSDANNGGAPGTVADKVAGMGDHRTKASAWLGGTGTPPAQTTQTTAGGGGIPLENLYSAVANPRLNDQQRSVIASMIEQRIKAADPMTALQMQQAQIQLAQSQLNLDQDRSGLSADAKVQTSVVLDDGSTVMVMNDGTRRVLSPTGEAVNGQAAADAIRAAREYGVANQRKIYGGRREGTLGADIALGGAAAGAKVTGENAANIETGGDAARVVAEGTAQGKANVETRSEVAEMERNMPGLLVVADQLSELADKATYTLGGRAANEVRKQLGLEPTEGAQARSEYIAVVDNQVLPLLRQTFGAAFTAKEGDTLRATLGDPDKSPAEKKAVLNAFIEQKKRDLMARGSTVPQAGAETFEQFAAQPSAIAASQKYGVSLEEMWAIKQGQK